MFFQSWGDVGRAALVTATVFLAVVALLRVVGQQALAKMSGYDLITSVTIGSVIATVAITRSITVSEALATLVSLLALQELVRWLQSRNLAMHHAVREPPRVVLWDGELLEDRLRESRVSADEVRAAVRKAGLRALSEARLVVLENDGEWSVVPKRSEPIDETAFFGLPIPGRAGNSPIEDAKRVTPAPDDRLP